MKIDLIFAAGSRGRRDFHGKTVVVIDVLRATSTIVTALTNGCLALYPVADPGTAALFRRKLGSDCLTGGERQGLKIPGFDLGNSPLEYTAETVAGQRIILTTTNGTQAMLEAEHAAEILIASFLNAGRTSTYLADKAEVVFFCAGTKGEPGLEDLLCAGLMTERLLASGVEAELTDAARIGLVAYRHLMGRPEADPVAVLHQAQHARGLVALGFSDDITYCAQIDSRPCVVRFRDGRITLLPEANTASEA
ncbi:2-phosphosulfolactate phosphatase [Capillibacterium thermochitinicola]|uniref:Probable 2-phosphosulfolactate phosphatase n=1 Tax=Capillibacterium thermochitinicola TaxID=2699427 RepID=A0A8J6LHX0_9FIRM|nr:2-phosphosulfolactate phosphatase [Capillibacterium thermochitinicola]MBA2131986.1 2-phosphosulfolactate phosphatase [Capillibacterium thermochitinicola]